MKKLILLRHGKAELFAATDFDRNLHESGFEQIKQRGAAFFEKKLIPDAIISSNAIRTTQTTETLLPFISFSLEKIHWKPNLYNASAEAILAEILRTDDAIQTLLVVGHNNGISEVLSFFTKEYYSLHPAGYAVLEFETQDWTELLEAKLVGMEMALE